MGDQYYPRFVTKKNMGWKGQYFDFPRKVNFVHE
jgi:hypothetical protein